MKMSEDHLDDGSKKVYTMRKREIKGNDVTG